MIHGVKHLTVNSDSYIVLRLKPICEWSIQHKPRGRELDRNENQNKNSMYICIYTIHHSKSQPSVNARCRRTTKSQRHK